MPLQRHRLNTRLIAFRKAKKNFISLPMSAHVIYSVKRQFHSNKFIHPSLSSNVYKFSFVFRFLKDWNKPGLSLGTWGISHSYMLLPPAILLENKRKMRLKELSGCSVPHLVTAKTQNFEILVTALLSIDIMEANTLISTYNRMDPQCSCIN